MSPLNRQSTLSAICRLFIAANIFFIFSVTHQAYASSCDQSSWARVAQSGQMVEGVDEALLLRMETALAEIRGNAVTFTAEIPEIKKLAPPSKLYSVLKTLYQEAREPFWYTMQSRAVGDAQAMTSESVAKLFRGYKGFTVLAETDDMRELVKAAKKSRAAREKVIVQLKKMAYVAEKVMGEPFDFTDADSIVRFFDVGDRKDLRAAAKERLDFNESLYQQTKSMIPNRETSQNNSYSTIASDLATDLYESQKIRRDRTLRPILPRIGQPENISGLIKKLNLPAGAEEKYLQRLSVIAAQPATANREKEFFSVMLLMRAFLDVFDEIPSFTRKVPAQRTIGEQEYLYVQSKINAYERSRIIIEERFAEYINKTDQLNARLISAKAELARLSQVHPGFAGEISEVASALPQKEVQDFDKDLDAIERVIRQAETGLDGVKEKIFKSVRNENINDFYDLNSRWQRLLPGKKYETAGVDYSHVTFSRDVIEHFKDDPLLGSRFLAALSKTYVAVKNASGLRRLPNIHADFRDIKLIKGHGKKRIIGRRVGDTIHFFTVYDSDRPYQDVPIRRLIENFQP